MDPAASLTPLLIDAKREYVSQLTDVLAPYVINRFVNMYIVAMKENKRAGVQAFQRALKAVPQWNGHVTNALASEVQAKYTFLGDLIAACFVAHVKVLSSVKLHHQKPHIRLKLPSNDTFVHKVYVHTAREFYANPKLVHADRGVKVGVVRGAVEAAVRDMLPIEDILKAYLGNTVDAEANSLKSEEMYDAQETVSFGAPSPAPQPTPQMMTQPYAPPPPAGDDDGSDEPEGPDSDDEPKQISFGPTAAAAPPGSRAPSRPPSRPASVARFPVAAPPPPPGRPASATTADDLFSDAEDDF